MKRYNQYEKLNDRLYPWEAALLVVDEPPIFAQMVQEQLLWPL